MNMFGNDVRMTRMKSLNEHTVHLFFRIFLQKRMWLTISVRSFNMEKYFNIRSPDEKISGQLLW